MRRRRSCSIKRYGSGARSFALRGVNIHVSIFIPHGFTPKNINWENVSFNNVDIKAASALGISVARVPKYSPYAVAEHAVALIQSVRIFVPLRGVHIRVSLLPLPNDFGHCLIFFL